MRWLQKFVLSLFASTCGLITSAVAQTNESDIDVILNALAKAVDCASCHDLLVPLKKLAQEGDEAYVSVFVAICKALQLEDDDVCQGSVERSGPIIAHDLRQISPFGRTATKLCDTLFGLCQPPAVNKHTVDFPPRQNRGLKDAPGPPSVPRKRKTPFQVAHLSDVHIDREYTPGADVDCTKNICCRNYPDSPSSPKVPARPMGEHGCDTTTALAESMLHAIPRNVSFSIFTGDVVQGTTWLVDEAGNTNDLQLFNNELATILNTPVYPAIGNHEAAPVNAFPKSTSSEPNASQWVYDTQGAGWRKWIGAAGANQVIHHSGSYSVVHPGTKLRVISLNTLFWYKPNYWLYDSDIQHTDPNGVLAFTIKELQAAEDLGQRAWIIAHMAPGRSDTLQDQSNYFDQVIQRYKHTIAGQFYGHSHHDQFGIAYSDYAHRSADTAVSLASMGPSLTPSGGNAAFKIYDVDPDTYEVMDWHVIRSDMDNPTFQTNPAWELYYSARATYGPLVGLKPNEALTPAFWHRLTEVFERNETAFQQYNTFTNRGVFIPDCDDVICKNLTICGLRALRAQDNCLKATPHAPLRKRDEKKRSSHIAHDDDCEGPGIGRIFSQLPLRLPTERSLLKAAIKKATAMVTGA